MSEQNTNPSAKQIPKLWLMVALLTILLLLLIGYKLRELPIQKANMTANLDLSCDLREAPCTSELPNGGSVTLSIGPDDIPILKDLKLAVEVEGIEVSNVEVDFIGISLDMAYNRPKLQQLSSSQFEGDTLLPICIDQRMDWEARVLLQTKKGQVIAPFRFFTLKYGEVYIKGKTYN